MPPDPPPTGEFSRRQREKLLDAVKDMKNVHSDRYKDTEKVIFLDESFELDRPVTNEKTASDSDRTVAFVQGHRYVSLTDLREGPEYTTELEEDN